MVGVMEYHRVDKEDEGTGGGGAPTVSRKMRAWTWLTAWTVAGTGMCGCQRWRKEATLHGIDKKKVSVILTDKASNTLGAVKEALTM